MSRPRSEPELSTYAGRAGARLAELREQHGYGMHEIQERLTALGHDVSVSSLYAYERGRAGGGCDLPLNLVPALARIYGVENAATLLPPS